MFGIQRNLLALAIATALTACGGDDGSNGINGTNGANGADGADGQDLVAAPSLIRLATLPIGSEVTGLYKTDNGELFFNVQHPSDTLAAPENLAAVGVVEGMDLDRLDKRLADVAVPADGSAEANTTQLAIGSYKVLGRAGDTYQGALPFGLGSIVNGANTQALKQSQDPDFNAFVAANADGSEGYLFTSWEDRPGAVSRMHVSRDSEGEWSVSDVMNVDFSAVMGTLINCFGTLSPWNTPLVAEENYEAENAENWNNPAYTSGYPSYTDVQLLQDYLGGTFPNPYRYGYIVEITQPTAAAPVPVKHFTLGRMAHENAVVMPDQKTVYLTDDGTDKGFYKFVATNPGDLSSGTLYAAKVTQDATSDTARAGMNLSWIELGTATNAQLETWIASYDNIDETDYVDGATSYITQAEIDDWAANGTGDDRYAFLETLRAAEAKGATVEFRKMEGININYHGAASGTLPVMYVAMSEVRSGMTDNEGDIQLTENRCGVVYRMGLDANYNTTRMEPVVVGGPYDSTAATNRCSTDGISNPDNLLVLDDGRVLIGEDTSNHENNMIWVYNPAGE
ncbi:PhoX family protein [Simiduia agarivorans]|uniref:Cell surface protein n=1 Tax=Simiduia agarivorans (strain DSM 21679 / JCM 13881 / BCRC 17597 / SA1) TaxID=1117647 RepID=K4KGF3_SIMAS|nr:alkaline phosphatase PhoX [Simiduia agarivorans]AFU97265.1 putative cell surface protein [Simiduia agarivorans SA1 = DSM 21679]